MIMQVQFPDSYFVRRTRDFNGKRIKEPKPAVANRTEKLESKKVDMRRYRICPGLEPRLIAFPAVSHGRD